MPHTAAFAFRKATKNDVVFLSQILANAAAASGVEVEAQYLAAYPDTYQYIEGFAREGDVGVIAETYEGSLVGAAWVRLLPTNAHAVHKPLPELTMGVLPCYQRMGVGKQLLEELYKAASAAGITEISLGVHQNNIPAIALYKQQHWAEDGSFKEYIMMSRNTK